jgi:isoquinoline 1-oxidoreductase beta subunit
MRLNVDGKTVDFEADPEMPLLWALRDIVGKTGPKFGCGIGACGACTVDIDGQPTRSCSIAVGDVTGDVTTIEGIAPADKLHAVQQAWIEEQVAQCGYCQAGQIMSAVALLNQISEPTDQEIDDAMSGNLCRCGTYPKIRAAIHKAAALQKTGNWLMASFKKIARRSFLVGVAALAGGVAVGYYFYRKPFANPLLDDLAEGEATFNPYVKIAADNKITIIAPRAEMGQGVANTLAALVAEELEVGLDQITVEHGPVAPVYYNAGLVGEGAPFSFLDESRTAEFVRAGLQVVGKLAAIQATGGSSSIRDAVDKMRQAGAAARILLISAAAQKLSVPEAELEAQNGAILHTASGASVTYGEVAALAATLPPPSDVPLKDKADWKLLGKSQKRLDMLDKVTGAPIFGIDVRLPDMLYGTIKMSPRFWSKPVSSDLSAAEKMPGVVKIVPLDTSYGHGFGIIAENTWAAFKAAEAIEATWAEAEYPADSAAVHARLIQGLDETGWSLRNDGDVEAALAAAPPDRVVEAEYDVPYQAHMTMEPMNATAQFKDGVLDVWCGNQSPTIARMLCAGQLGIEQDKVNIHTTALGGGFGRRLEVDYALCAAALAKETEGRPIKVTWTREEDTTHGA